MSVFLGWSSALIAAGQTTSQMQATFSSLLTSTTVSGSSQWQVLRQAVIGTPWSTGGTSFLTPANAFDMTSTTSATTTTLPAYVGVYYASGFIPTQLYIQSDNANSVNYAPMTFTLDYSSNGSSWTTLQSFTGQTSWLYAERRKYAITGATSQNYWRINVTAAQTGSTCYIGDVQLEDTNGNWLTTQNFFDCIPGTTETIGNSYSRDVLRWIFPSAGTSIQFRPIQELLTTLPQMYSWTAATAGAVTCSITINANTVSFVGTSGNTALQNARGLYEACRTSANANFTAWTWVWPSAIVAATGGANFYAVANVSAMNIPITSSNITTAQRSTSVYTVPLVQGCQFSNTNSITIDLINGWIYYLQVCSRGIAIGSKTNASYYTPVHMCYGDNTSTVAQIPTADLAAYGIPCTPIELMVGTDNVVADSDGSAITSHWWIVPGAATGALGTGQVETATGAVWSPFAHHLVTGQVQDLAEAGFFWGGATFEMSGEGIFQGADVGNTYSIHRNGCTPTTLYLNICFTNNAGPASARGFGPNYVNLDWYKFTGTAPASEQLLISPSNDFTTTVTTTTTNSATTIVVGSTTGFPTSGWIVIDGEIINYGGTTGTSFTSCVRGKYTTTPISPIAGTTVYIGAWFCFIIQGLIMGGYQLPT